MGCNRVVLAFSIPSILSAGLIAWAGCSQGESSDDKPTSGAEERTDDADDADDDEGIGMAIGSRASRAISWGRDVGEGIGDRVEDTIDDTVDGARRYADWAEDWVTDVSTGVASRARERADGTRKRLGTLGRSMVTSAYLNATTTRFGAELTRLGDATPDPSALGQAKRFALRQVPVVGLVDRYADARALYAKYADGADEMSRAMRQVAKRQCLILCMQTGLDMTLLGLPGVVELPVVVADQVVDKALLADKARASLGSVPWVSLSWAEMAKGDLDVLTPLLDRALERPSVDQTMVEILTVDFSKPLFD